MSGAPTDEFFERTQHRPKCCDEDYGGSHYHCAQCGEVTGMMGHFLGDRIICDPVERKAYYDRMFKSQR